MLFRVEVDAATAPRVPRPLCCHRYASAARTPPALCMRIGGEPVPWGHFWGRGENGLRARGGGGGSFEPQKGPLHRHPRYALGHTCQYHKAGGAHVRDGDDFSLNLKQLNKAPEWTSREFLCVPSHRCWVFIHLTTILVHTKSREYWLPVWERGSQSLCMKTVHCLDMARKSTDGKCSENSFPHRCIPQTDQRVVEIVLRQCTWGYPRTPVPSPSQTF